MPGRYTIPCVSLIFNFWIWKAIAVLLWVFVPATAPKPCLPGYSPCTLRVFHCYQVYVEWQLVTRIVLMRFIKDMSFRTEREISDRDLSSKTILNLTIINSRDFSLRAKWHVVDELIQLFLLTACLLINTALCNLGKQAIAVFFLLQGSFQQINGFIVA